MSKQCTTHHHACDCREKRLRKLISDLHKSIEDAGDRDRFEKIVDVFWCKQYGCCFNDDKRFKP